MIPAPIAEKAAIVVWVIVEDDRRSWEVVVLRPETDEIETVGRFPISRHEKAAKLAREYAASNPHCILEGIAA